MLTGAEKFMTATLVLIGFALVLTNPQGDAAAGSAIGGIYQSVVGAFFKPK